MRRELIINVILCLGLLTVAAWPSRLDAQEQRNVTDFRGRTNYSEEDLARSLFPEAQSEVRTRGIGPVQPQSQPQPAPGKTSVALNVFFAFNSDRILAEYHDDLNKLGKVLTDPQYAAYRVEIEGHTDNIGSDSYNQRLSIRRAESVRRYLEQHFRIEPKRLVAKGFGETRPMASNDTPEGRSKNRRVEVVNMGKITP